MSRQRVHRARSTRRRWVTSRCASRDPRNRPLMSEARALTQLIRQPRGDGSGRQVSASSPRSGAQRLNKRTGRRAGRRKGSRRVGAQANRRPRAMTMPDLPRAALRSPQCNAIPAPPDRRRPRRCGRLELARASATAGPAQPRASHADRNSAPQFWKRSDDCAGAGPGVYQTNILRSRLAHFRYLTANDRGSIIARRSVQRRSARDGFPGDARPVCDARGDRSRAADQRPSHARRARNAISLENPAEGERFNGALGTRASRARADRPAAGAVAVAIIARRRRVSRGGAHIRRAASVLRLDPSDPTRNRLICIEAADRILRAADAMSDSREQAAEKLGFT